MKLLLVIGHWSFELPRSHHPSIVMPLIASSLLAAQTWYIVPLILSVSLVYGATRHELPRPILYHAWHTAVWMTVFMGGIFLVLWLVSLFV
jgi:hypothetical protein